MHLRPAAVLLFVLAASAPAQKQAAPPALPTEQEVAAMASKLFVPPAVVAQQFLAAFRDHDDAAMRKLIDQAPAERLDLVRTADELLGLHLEAHAPPGAGDFLPAAAALAERIRDRHQDEGLVDLVAGWRSLDAEGIAREAAARDLLHRLQATLMRQDLPGALELAEQARAVADRAPRSCTAVSLRFLAGITLTLADRGLAGARSLQAAAAAAAAIRWHFGRAEVLGALSEAALNHDDLVGAVVALVQECGLRQSCGHPRREAELLLMLGDVLSKAGALGAGLALYEQSRALSDALGDRDGVARALWEVGAVHQLRGRHMQARMCLEQSTVLFEALGNQARAMRARGLLGLVLCESGKAELGQPLLDRAQREAERLEDSFLLAEILGHRGDVYREAGQTALAAAAYEGARQQALKIGDAVNAACNLGNTAICHLQAGRFAEAIAAEEQAVRELEACGRRLNAAESLAILGRIYLDLRDYAAAIAATERAIQHLDAIGQKRVLGSACYNLGVACSKSGEYRRAAAAYQRARTTCEAQGNLLEAAKALCALGRIQLILEPDRALETLEQARAASTASGDPASAAFALRAIGIMHCERHDYTKSLEVHERAVTEFRSLGDREFMADALEGVARCQNELGRPAAAVIAAREAMAVWTSLGRDQAESDAIAVSNRGCDASWLGVDAARRLASGAKDGEQALDEALWFLESGRGLVLLSGLFNRTAMMAANVAPELCAAEAEARKGLGRAQQELLQFLGCKDVEPAQVTAARERLDAAYQALEAAVARTQREAARAAAVVHPEPVTLAALRASLQPDELLVQCLGSDFHTLAVAIGKDSGLIVDLGDSDELDRRATACLELFAVDHSDDGGAAAALYDALLRPLETVLSGKKRLLLSLEGVLAFVPVEALVRVEAGRRQRVVERFETAYVPSGTVLVALRAEARQTPRGHGLLALGDPVYPGEDEEHSPATARRNEAELRGLGGLRRLRGTGDEVRAIGDLFPAAERTLLLREQASLSGLEQAVAKKSGRLAAVHLACHGHLDLDRPRLTGLVLAGGEVLTLDRMYQLRVPADLAVLSACETAKGRIYRGEGVVGMVRGFFFGGCPRVVVSDWKVSDESTRTLMVDFYRRMAQGLAPAAALREARLARLHAGGATAHPYHWAGFVCWGLPD